MIRRRDRQTRVRRSRPRRRAGRVLWNLSKLVIGVAILGGLVYAVILYTKESPAFLVKKVKVEGANVLRESAILEAAAITADTNLMSNDPAVIEKRVEAIPYVKSCQVQRVVPDTIIIKVVERVGFATLVVNNTAYEIDAEGYVLRVLEPGAAHTGPMITNVGGIGVIEVGQQLTQPTLRKALEVWAAFSAVPLSKKVKVSEISAPSENYISMFIDEANFEIRWGRSEFVEQAKRLDVLWSDKGGDLKCSEYLDLRFDDGVACK